MNNPQSPQTEEFHIKQVSFILSMLWHHAWFTLLMLSVTAIGLIILGICFDIRYIILGLMVVFIGLPFIISLLYFVHGFREEAFINIMPHRITFLSQDTINVRVSFPKKLFKSEEKELKEAMENDSISKEEIQESTPPYRDYTFTLKKSQPYKVSSNGIILLLSGKRRGFIPIPYSSFSNQETLKRVIDILAPKQTL